MKRSDCGCGPVKDDRVFYDLDILRKQTLKIDRLIDFVATQNESKLSRLRVPSNVLRGFYIVTPELVNAFEKDGSAHVRHILDNRSEYGLLYDLVDHRDHLFNSLRFDYDNFPLVSCDPAVKDDVLRRVQKTAAAFFKPDTLPFDATCLTLLYFYALLVNPEANWTILDHLSDGNKFHKYLTRLAPFAIRASARIKRR